jgi:folate-dependent phosphoribosylglycinamide formyltransferase PurN
MLKKLRQHWKVNSADLFFILLTFAVTGTFTAWVSKGITGWLSVEKFTFGWWALKIGVLFIGYQVFILIFGFCFGKFSFFWNYEKRILTRMGFLKKIKPVTRIAIFASGNGSNAGNIISYFKDHPSICVALVVCNNPLAGVIEVAKKNNVGLLMINKEMLNNELAGQLKQKEIHWLVLAGFLWKIPHSLIHAFPHRIINIHPALLPKFGGKGMFGSRVHEAVIQSREKESGITIHYVDDIYDNGKIIYQASCGVETVDPAELANKIHTLEHAHYPVVIEELIQKAKTELNQNPQ